MSFTLPELPYAMDKLHPHVSKETLEYHYGKHHKAYVDNLNKLVQGTKYEKMELPLVISTSREERETGIFNNAAQHWNHSFYWNCLSPNGGGEPKGSLHDAIKKTWGSYETFQQKYTEATTKLFGAGWSWLGKNADGTLTITQTSNAENPVGNGSTPLLTCDVWEHAYYIDYRNQRPKYVENFWKVINWDYVQKNYETK